MFLRHYYICNTNYGLAYYLMRSKRVQSSVLIPPSNVVCLPHIRGPLEPALSLLTRAAPLSDVKMTRVSRSLEIITPPPLPSHCYYQFLPWFAPDEVQYLAHTPVKLHHGISVGTLPGAPLAELPAGVGRPVGRVWSQVEEIGRALVWPTDELQRLVWERREVRQYCSALLY